jgi:hypothetical protein
MFNLDSQETSAATIPLFLTFFFAEIFVVKEKYSASALQVTVIEYALCYDVAICDHRTNHALFHVGSLENVYDPMYSSNPHLYHNSLQMGMEQ